MKLVVFALVLGVAYGACPNGCSGHGSCGTSDVCGCYNGWWGGDCSYRSCPSGVSWTATPYDTLQDDRNTESILLNTPGAHSDQSSDHSGVAALLYPKIGSVHQYSECSSRGTCDYSTGQCKCFDGFNGKGCRRTTCPNDCSGHGRCLTNSEVSDSSSHVPNNDQFWDQDKTQQCQCDRGYSGYDCSDRVCPFGDDPTTECGEQSGDDFQLVVVTDSSGSGTETFFTLRFTDMFGGEFETRPIQVSKCSASGGDSPCREVQYALMELPNFAIPNVEVDQLDDSLGTANEVFYRVHFVDSSNTGKQNSLACSGTNDPTGAGSAPLYSPVAGCAVHDVGVPEWYDDQGTEQSLSTAASSSLTQDDVLGGTSATTGSDVAYDSFVPCASKGLCDSSTGKCSCFDGHFGEACEEQSTYY